MVDKLLGVQFLHPGGEGEPDDQDGRLRRWNTGDHCRKFMRAKGSMLDRAALEAGRGPRRSEFDFWGEWEPPSRVEALPATSDRRLPRYLHRPIFEYTAAEGKLQNTDPFVFGPRFRYTICRQYREKQILPGEAPGQHARPTQLARLQENSVILFGSAQAKRFVLDTVLVVGGFTDWGEDRPVIDDGTDADGIYRDATLQQLDPRYPLRLYHGVHYRDRKQHHGMFSFAPCRPADGEGSRFARPSLDIDGTRHGQTQGYSFLARDLESTITLWHNVKDYLLNQGFSLAVEIDMPKRSGANTTPPKRGASSRC